MTKRKKYRGGASTHPLFRRWTHIRQHQRQNPHLDSDWDCFWDFADDIEHYLGLPPTAKHRLHRRDQTQGWLIHNLCWELQPEITAKVQGNMVRYRNKTQCLAAWSRELGISYFTLLRRYHRACPNRLLFKQP